MRTVLALLLLAAPAWASPPAAPDAKKAPVKVEPKPAPRKAEAPKPSGALDKSDERRARSSAAGDAKVDDKHVETKKADAASSTLTLPPKKKPARRVLLADWAP